jgi:hypothetical protein
MARAVFSSIPRTIDNIARVKNTGRDSARLLRAFDALSLLPLPSFKNKGSKSCTKYTKAVKAIRLIMILS